MGRAQNIGSSAILRYTVTSDTYLSLYPVKTCTTSNVYAALAQGGSDSTGMSQMPWGAYWGCTLDRFGVRWMLNVAE